MNTLSHLLLGHDSRQRLRITRMLIAAGVYLFCWVLQWHSVWVGYTAASVAGAFSLFMLLGLLGFYAALRSGFNLRFAEPALTWPQSVFALLSLAAAYRINPHARGAMMMVVALVLVFAAFTLSPRMCRLLAWIAVSLLGLAMAWGISSDPARFDKHTELVHALVMLAVLPTIGLLTGELSRIRFEHQGQRRALKTALGRLQQLAMHDELTGLPNRRHLRDWLGHAPSPLADKGTLVPGGTGPQAPADAAPVAPPRRSSGAQCLALIDIDHFKQINDSLGHDAGDTVLRLFAREARSLLREGDVLARWGGEEFMLVMPDTGLDAAERVLARLTAHLQQHETWAEFPPGQVTFSAGLTLKLPTQSLDEAVRAADTALYEAKRQGRNRVVRAPH